jgi:hypothetical protein
LIIGYIDGWFSGYECSEINAEYANRDFESLSHRWLRLSKGNLAKSSTMIGTDTKVFKENGEKD